MISVIDFVRPIIFGARIGGEIPTVQRPEAAPARGNGEFGMAVQIEAQITGSIWKIETSVGDRVEEEEVLLIIESMKMEIPVEAPCSGRVHEIRVEEGQNVEEGEVLVVLE